MKKLSLYLIFLTALLVFLGNCATNKMEYISKNYEIYGTWGNPEYENGSSYYAKLIFNPNGSVLLHKVVSDKTTTLPGTFYITNKWIDSNGGVWHTYQLFLEGMGPSCYYVTTKISDNGGKIECSFSIKDYPSKIDPSDPVASPSYIVLFRE